MRDCVGFFNQLDLTDPRLARIKGAVEAGAFPMAKEELVRHVRERSSPRYFFDPDERERIVKLVKEHYPQCVVRTIAEADEVGRHYLRLDSADHFQLPERINWNDSHMPYEDRNVLNRHAFLVTLGKAYWYTENERYARTYANLLRSWIEDNPYDRRAQPWRTLEVGIRSDNWLLAYTFFLHSPSVTTEDHITLLQSFLEHAECLYENSIQFRKGNWQVLEAAGLSVLGIGFPEFQRSSVWVQRGLDRLDDHLKKDLLADGWHSEMATGYHIGCALGTFTAGRLSILNGIELPDGFWSKLERMFDVILGIIKPDGQRPLLNDCPSDSMRGQLSLGAILFQRPDMKFVGSPMVEEPLFWYLGPRALEEYQQMKPCPPSFTSVGFSTAHYYVMRSGWDKDARYLISDSGVSREGHRHWDKLSIDVYAYGNTLIADPGIYTYSDPTHTGWFVTTEAHNTIKVDDREQIQDVTPLSFNEWLTGEEFHYVDAASGDYAPVIHRRSIFFVKPEYWLITDLLTGEGSHTYDLLFHFRPTTLLIDPETKSIRTQSDEANIIIVPADPEETTVQEKVGWVATVQRSSQEDVRDKLAAPYVKLRKCGQAPAVFDTVLYPYPRGKKAVVRVRRVAISENGQSLSPWEASGLEIRIDNWTDLFFRSHSGRRRLEAEDFEFDAEILHIRKDAGGKLVRRMVKGAYSVLQYRGRDIHCCS